MDIASAPAIMSSSPPSSSDELIQEQTTHSQCDELNPSIPTLRNHSLLSKSESKIHGMECRAINPIISRHSKHELYKEQRKMYQAEKKRAAKEFVQAVANPSLIIMADWLKVRSILKSWTLLYCVVKPGLMLLYKSEKQRSRHWVGTLLLNVCEVIERPSKKDGFCFKIFHPLEQSIWAPKGPKGESMGALTRPLPYPYCIFRAPSEGVGRVWMEALEVSLSAEPSKKGLRVPAQLTAASTLTSLSSLAPPAMDNLPQARAAREPPRSAELDPPVITFFAVPPDAQQPLFSVEMNDSDRERHFDREELDVDEDLQVFKDESESESENSVDMTVDMKMVDEQTKYERDREEDFAEIGEDTQTEEVSDENKSLIWSLLKQVRPGVDLSKVVLPTFILEPRSFLEKLADYYFHADILSSVPSKADPLSRMKDVVKFYLSGFYKRPKGLKKPYNPIMGEVFRCYWEHPQTKSRTFYVAEQISHHPPVSAFHVTNRQDGFSVSGNILARSKFYGNSLSAIMDGQVCLTFLNLGENYVITLPYAHCKGILVGTLTMELGGKVAITCEKTGYCAELEFKLRPMFSAEDKINRVVGKIKLGAKTLCTISGCWDKQIMITDKQNEEVEVPLWSANDAVKASRLPRYCVPIDAQEEFESRRLWRAVTDALLTNDQQQATEAKSALEEKQRQEIKERKLLNEQWHPRMFEFDAVTEGWQYKYTDERPWDPINDLYQQETKFRVHTVQRHPTPLVRSTSIVSMATKRRLSCGNKALHLSNSSGQLKSAMHSVLPATYEQEPEQDNNGESSADGEAVSSANTVARTNRHRRPNDKLADDIAALIGSQKLLQDDLKKLVQSTRGIVKSLDDHVGTRVAWRWGGAARDVFLVLLVVAVQLTLLSLDCVKSRLPLLARP